MEPFNTAIDKDDSWPLANEIRMLQDDLYNFEVEHNELLQKIVEYEDTLAMKQLELSKLQADMDYKIRQENHRLLDKCLAMQNIIDMQDIILAEVDINISNDDWYVALRTRAGLNT